MSAKRRKTKEAAAPPVLPSPQETDQSKKLVQLFNKIQLDDFSTGSFVMKPHF
jgi:hypothetical protein